MSSSSTLSLELLSLRRNLAEKGDEPGEVLNNISTCVILDLRDLGLVHCSQKMMDQMKLYIGNERCSSRSSSTTSYRDGSSNYFLLLECFLHISSSWLVNEIANLTQLFDLPHTYIA